MPPPPRRFKSRSDRCPAASVRTRKVRGAGAQQSPVNLVALEVLKEPAGERWPDVAEQAPTVYAVWGGGATPAQALYMVGLILPP
jgi:hypothetical protein